MDNSINQTNLNRSEIKNAYLGNTPKDASELRREYKNFVTKMNNSDFCNSKIRYIAEITYIQRLKELYFEYKRQDLLQEMIERETFISEKLKNEFGITFTE